jgi:hypothetical protein
MAAAIGTLVAVLLIGALVLGFWGRFRVITRRRYSSHQSTRPDLSMFSGGAGGASNREGSDADGT